MVQKSTVGKKIKLKGIRVSVEPRREHTFYLLSTIARAIKLAIGLNFIVSVKSIQLKENKKR